MPDILQTIVTRKCAEVALARQAVPEKELRARAKTQSAPRDFTGAIRAKLAANKPAVIAEMKKASPSKGLLRQHYRPADIARSYADHGAACLSVLTDHDFFHGKPEDLMEARAACSLPVLRKDFLLEPYQVYESRALGADCVLLIVAVLGLAQMQDLEALAQSLGMAVLVEVHDEAELGMALELSSVLVGINNRNLHTFETHIENTLRLLPRIPEGKMVVTESGITTPHDVMQLRNSGVSAFLIGEAFMRSDNPGEKLDELFN